MSRLGKNQLRNEFFLLKKVNHFTDEIRNLMLSCFLGEKMYILNDSSTTEIKPTNFKKLKGLKL